MFADRRYRFILAALAISLSPHLLTAQDETSINDDFVLSPPDAEYKIVEAPTESNFEIVLTDDQLDAPLEEEVLPLRRLTMTAESHSWLRPEGSAPKMAPKAIEKRMTPIRSPKAFHFEAANFRHRQLLFEEPMLERHGATRYSKLQPFVSGATFIQNSAKFPFQVFRRKHRTCDSSLGWGTPGSQKLNCPPQSQAPSTSSSQH